VLFRSVVLVVVLKMSRPVYTPVSDIPSIVAQARKAFNSGKTRDINFRKQQLKQIQKLLQENEKEWREALHQDLKMGDFASNGEFSVCLKDLKVVLSNLDSWVSPTSVGVPLLTLPGSAKIMHEPLGVICLISPWNYPLSLIIKPLIGVIAGGNTAVIKPSEVSAATEATFAKLLPKYLDNDCFKIIRGAAEETTVLLRERFDHIFYTGNGAVGKVVMKAAAEYLTPVTLELGGKSPCIVDRDVDLDKAVPRLTWGKFYNAGQTCIAPDYVLVHKDLMQPLVEKIQRTIKQFYGDDPSQSTDFCKIINSRHTNRLKQLLNGQKVVAGGQVDVDKCYVSPTLVVNPEPNSSLMADEIFGPILPIIPINNIDEAIEFINSREKPLALYIFSKNNSTVQKVLQNTSSGGAGVNECLLHNICPELPFGGVGPSGMGSYNAKFTFRTFTHEKGVLSRPQSSDPSLRFPPYTPGKIKMLSRLNSLDLPSKKTVLSILTPLVLLAVAWWLGPEKIRHFLKNDLKWL